MAGDDASTREQKQASDHPSSSSDIWPEDDNPFVAFRRFADEQISSMLQSVMGLPSMSSDPMRDQWTIFADEEKYRGPARQRTAGEGQGGGNNSSEGSETPTQSQWTDSEHHNNIRRCHRRRWHDRSSDFFGLDSFFDGPWLNDRFPISFRFFHPYHHPFFADVFNDSDSPMWPMSYLMFSPYSPLHLERQAHYRARRERGIFSSIMSSLGSSSERDPAEPQWREAFEDLLRLENGKPMLDRDPEAISKKETGTDWLQGLVKRGSLGDRWKYVSGPDGRSWSGITYEGWNGSDKGHSKPEKRAETTKTSETPEPPEKAETTTELDSYDRFLRDIEARERDSFSGLPESPLLRFLLEERRRFQDEIADYKRRLPPSEVDNRNEETQNWLELVSGGNRNSVSEIAQTTASDSTAAVDSESRIISTMTNTERIRLPDGSVQTKTIRTKRFADGREETNESVEVSKPQNAQDSNRENRNDGWFWK